MSATNESNALDQNDVDNNDDELGPAASDTGSLSDGLRRVLSYMVMQPTGVTSVLRNSRSRSPHNLGIENVVSWILVTDVLRNIPDSRTIDDMEQRMRVCRAIYSGGLRTRVRSQRNSTANVIRDRTVTKTSRKIQEMLSTEFNDLYAENKSRDEFMADMRTAEELMSCIVGATGGLPMFEGLLPVSLFAITWILFEVRFMGRMCTTKVRTNDRTGLRMRSFMTELMEEITLSATRHIIRNDGLVSCVKPVLDNVPNSLVDESCFMTTLSLSCVLVVDMLMVALRMQPSEGGPVGGRADISGTCAKALDYMIDPNLSPLEFKRRVSELKAQVDENPTVTRVKKSVVDNMFNSFITFTACLTVSQGHNRGFTAIERGSHSRAYYVRDDDLTAKHDEIRALNGQFTSIYERVKQTEHVTQNVRSASQSSYEVHIAGQLCKFWLQIIQAGEGFTKVMRKVKRNRGETDVNYMRRLRRECEKYFVMGCFLHDCTGNICEMYQDTISTLLFNIVGKGTVPPGRMVARQRRRKDRA